jgi:hypothetical protein
MTVQVSRRQALRLPDAIRIAKRFLFISLQVRSKIPDSFREIYQIILELESEMCRVPGAAARTEIAAAECANYIRTPSGHGGRALFCPRANLPFRTGPTIPGGQIQSWTFSTTRPRPWPRPRPRGRGRCSRAQASVGFCTLP